MIDPRATLTPYPRGWYCVAPTEDVPIGGVKPVKMFGRDVVVFRTEDGKPHVANAHCPHMGAHLGHGGQVKGACIRCPFHGWEYRGSDGECSRIPYGDAPPKKARLTNWPVQEVGGVILAWYHEEGAEPDWFVRDFPDWEGEYSEWKQYEWTVRARIQDISENDADVAHAQELHKFVDSPAENDFTTNGPECDWVLHAQLHAKAFGIPKWAPVPRALDIDINIRRSGISLGWVRQSTTLPPGIHFETQSLATCTPIDQENCRVILRHRAGRSRVPGMTRLIRFNYAKLFNWTLEEDIVMWENKIYRMRPAASKTDAAILKFRKWTQQFYPPGAYDEAVKAQTVEATDPSGDHEAAE